MIWIFAIFSCLIAVDAMLRRLDGVRKGVLSAFSSPGNLGLDRLSTYPVDAEEYYKGKKVKFRSQDFSHTRLRRDVKLQIDTKLRGDTRASVYDLVGKNNSAYCVKIKDISNNTGVQPMQTFSDLWKSEQIILQNLMSPELKHTNQNVISVYAYSTEQAFAQDKAFILEENIQGTTLEDLFVPWSSEFYFDQMVAQWFAFGLGRALRFLHNLEMGSHTLFHMSVDPKNIIIENSWTLVQNEGTILKAKPRVEYQDLYDSVKFDFSLAFYDDTAGAGSPGDLADHLIPDGSEGRNPGKLADITAAEKIIKRMLSTRGYNPQTRGYNPDQFPPELGDALEIVLKKFSRGYQDQDPYAEED